jgi:hypothetical protein
MRRVQTGNHVGNQVLGNGMELFLRQLGFKCISLLSSPRFASTFRHAIYYLP